MAAVTLAYRHHDGDRARRKEFEGQDVGYEEADEVLGEDFVRIWADDETFSLPKDNVVYLHVRK